MHSPTAAVGAMLLGSLSTACSDVVVDSLVVERARGEPAVGAMQMVAQSKFDTIQTLVTLHVSVSAFPLWVGLAGGSVHM